MLSQSVRAAPRPINGYVCFSCLIQSQYSVRSRLYTSSTATEPSEESESTIIKKTSSRYPSRRRNKRTGLLFKDVPQPSTEESAKPTVHRKVVSRLPKVQVKADSNSKNVIKRITSQPAQKSLFRRVASKAPPLKTPGFQKLSTVATGAQTTSTTEEIDSGTPNVEEGSQHSDKTAVNEDADAEQSVKSSKKPKKRSSSGTRRVIPKKVEDSDYDVDARKIIETTEVENLEICSVKMPDQPLVPGLSYGLDRVLFNPGVYQLQDPRSRVFNFDPYLQKIMPIAQFDFAALKEYITSSRDTVLKEVAQSQNKKYTGSSSSMTSALAHFHFLISQWRPINTNMMSQGFLEKEKNRNFTVLQRGPSACFLKWKDGSYAIDADKQFDTANILSMLGKSMEKLLTLETEAFERYRVENSDQISAEERNLPEAFHYSTMGDFLMRSQLDAHDARLPGTGMFDLKTRAVVSIRMDTDNYQKGMGYEIRNLKGDFESYEREYYDMIRSAFLKYSLQVRMGRMDGIFVAFHNVERIFGFQYISLPEMDKALHGSSDVILGDQEFKLSVDLLNKVLDRATTRFPEQSLRLHFETRDTQTPFMYIFAEPVTEEQIDEIQGTNVDKIAEFEKKVLGLHRDDGPSEASETSSPATWDDLHADVERELQNDEQPRDAKSAEDSEAIQEVQEGQHQLEDEVSKRSSFEATSDRSAQPFSSTMAEQTDISTIGISLSESLKASNNPAEPTQNDLNEQVEEISSLPSDEMDNPIEKEQVDEPQDSTAENDLLESRHHGDKDWIDGIEQEQSNVVSEDTNDVLAMTLTIRNKVNGRYVTRPEDLSPQDRWAVEYSLAEVPGAARSWSLYNACQARRKKALVTADDKENDYFRRLRAMSAAGRSWRTRQDKVDQKMGTRVYGAPPPSIADEFADSNDGRIELEETAIP